MLEDKISVQKDFYETLLKAQSDLGEGLVIVEDERIVYANGAFLRISGYGQEELAALPSCFDLLVEEERTLFDGSLRRWQIESQLVVEHYETAILHKNGERVYLECAAKALQTEDGRTQLLVLTHDVTERMRAQEKLEHSLDCLLALHEAGQALVSTLRLEEVGERILEIIQRVSNPIAAVINLRDGHQQLHAWHSMGSKGFRDRAQGTTEAKEARHSTLETRKHRLFELRSSNSGPSPLVGLYLPLWVGDEVIGLLEVYGPQDLAEKDTVRLFDNLATQAASALENARLYGELAERERRMMVMVGRLLGAQEEERRRVAREVHDSLAQVAVSAHQHLQSFANQHPPGSPQAQEKLKKVQELVKRTVGEARTIIADLRPAVLDDFGLASAIRFEVERLRKEGWHISYEESSGEERLPAVLETALFRVLQESLTNVRKHAQTTRVQLGLSRLGEKVRLQVRDHGCGFEPSALEDEPAGPGEHIGLSSMRERIALVGGEFKVQSKPGFGTLVVVDVTLPAPATHEGRDLP